MWEWRVIWISKIFCGVEFWRPRALRAARPFEIRLHQHREFAELDRRKFGREDRCQRRFSAILPAA
jgi:hypothetical protein